MYSRGNPENCGGYGMTKREWLADGLLLLTALIWGSAFAVVKNTLDSFPPSAIIAMRYAVGTALTAVMFRKHLRGLTRGDYLRSALLGVLLCTAYIVQTIGLQYTTAGKNAFLTAVYVLLVPLGCFALFRERLRAGTLAAAAMMLLGIGLLSLDGQSGGLNKGDVLTLVSGVFYAAHIIAVERCQKKSNPYALIVLQFAVTAVLASGSWLVFERDIALSFSAESVGGLLYLAVFSTTIAMSLQNIGQSMAPSSHASILLSLESVIGAAFSCLLLGERLSPRMALGFAVIFAALLVNQIGEKKTQ